jgi:glycosyltransferase involved in cell wall biosynthesis
VRHFTPRRLVSGRVSIITPTYRRLDGLREAIESVRAQEHADWEQLVVADGHDDRVRDLVGAIGDPRVSYHHTRPFHVVGNYQRNYALRFATGEFILYLDDDNVIYPHCLATMVGGFAPETGYVVCGIHYGPERKVLQPEPGFRVQQIDTLNFMVRRELVERVGGYGANYSADFGLISRVASMARGNFLGGVVGHHR